MKLLRTTNRTILSVAMITAIVGCTSNQASGTDAASSKGTDSKSIASTATNETKLPLANPPVTINYMVLDNPTSPVVATAPVMAELQKRTGVNFNFIKTDDSGYEDKFKITLASGKLPDMMYATPVNMKLYGPQGAFLPLDDLLQKYGQNILSAMKDRGIYNDMKAADGHIYGLPKIRESIMANAFMVRQDWLDQYGIKTPENLDEFYTMLKTIKEKDPAGNGSTIPLGVFGNPDTFHDIYSSFGADSTFFIKDGKMVYGPSMPQMKDALAYVHKLYADKLIDQDFSVLSKTQWQARGSSGQYGALIYNAQRTDYFTQVLQKQNPKAKMVAIAPLKGPDGKQVAVQQNLLGNVAVLSKDTKNPELLIKLFNYVFSPEGQTLMSYGINGDSYEMKDGKPTYTAKMYQKPENTTYQDVSHEYGMFGWVIPVNPTPKIDEELYKGTLTGDAVKLQNSYYLNTFPYPTLSFTDQENVALKSKLTSIKDLTNQYQMKFITGQDTLDHWDDFINKLKTAGLDDVTKIYNDAYARYLK
ncbi:extracellular solute-binding protein [Paenibacillus cremeus]|uniref:Extracellular solute-binding protein n=1 Tax=Paenibacillus cremeus TaxID=2163881 RepID=A0A559K4W1_9BACL|nr:extracellular solute-binding protein [Paenibacillus cremeus]TVY07179.1 extracellular solute-binding protein [Paenibacillus cremeus]